MVGVGDLASELLGRTAGPREIPSTSLRAGSCLRLKNGCGQDDALWDEMVHTCGGPELSFC
jgi:hypothetical protein